MNAILQDIAHSPRIWLTTDTHFNHAKLVEFGRPRDFADRTLRALHASCGTGDTLIHLGDLAIGKDAEAIEKLREAVHGRPIILIRGNHDNKSTTWYLRHGIAIVCDEMTMRVNGRTVLLTHMPQPRRSGVDINIHGHTHGNAHREHESAGIYEDGYHVEIALENNAYQPWLLMALTRI